MINETFIKTHLVDMDTVQKEMVEYFQIVAKQHLFGELNLTCFNVML